MEDSKLIFAEFEKISCGIFLFRTNITTKVVVDKKIEDFYSNDVIMFLPQPGTSENVWQKIIDFINDVSV